MTGSWGVFAEGQRWRRSPRRAWLVLPRRGPRGRAVRRPGARAHDRGAHALRPAARRARARHPRPRVRRATRFLRRLREDDPTRPIGDALLDQRTVAGHRDDLGKARAASPRRVDPWRRTRRVGDDEALAVIDAVRPRMARSRDGRLRPGAHRDLRQGGAAVPALRRARSGQRAGRRQPSDILVPRMPDLTPRDAQAHRPQGRRPHRARQHAGELRRRARGRRRHGRVRRAARAPRRHGRGSCSPTTTGSSTRGAAITLEEGLAHFAQDAWAGVELDVDLKLPGYERRVVDALREHGLAERALISTMEETSLRGRARADPRIRLGWSVPKMRRNPLSSRSVPACPRWSSPGTPSCILPGRAADGDPRAGASTRSCATGRS